MNKSYEKNYRRMLKRYNEENGDKFETYDELAEEFYNEHTEVEKQRMITRNSNNQQSNRITRDSNNQQSDRIKRDYQQSNQITRNSNIQQLNIMKIHNSGILYTSQIMKESYERNYKRIIKKYNEENDNEFETYDEVAEKSYYNDPIEVERQRAIIINSNNQQSNQITRNSNSQQSDQIIRNSNNQQSDQIIRNSNNQQSDQIIRNSNNQQSDQITRNSNNQQSNRVEWNFSSRSSTSRIFQSSRNELFGNQNSNMRSNFNDNYPSNRRESNHIRNYTFGNPTVYRFNSSNNGTFGNEPLEKGDFMDDFEIDRRFPKDENNHLTHHYPKNKNLNGMNHHVIDEDDKESNLKCMICLTEFDINEKAYELRCGHIFHEDCFVPWRDKHNSCPVCRQQISKREPPDNSRSCVIC